MPYRFGTVQVLCYVNLMPYRFGTVPYATQQHVCFLIDPPYLSTQTLTYNGYWRLSDYLDVLHTLHGTNYFYFTSDKSSLVELCEWLERERYLANPFAGATRINQTTNLNHNSRYTDIRGPHKPVGVVGCHIMLYRHIQSQPQTLLNAA